MTTYLGKSCSFCLPRVPFVYCRQFMYLVISLLVLRAGYGIWLYQFLIIAYLFTLLALEPCNYSTLLLLLQYCPGHKHHGQVTSAKLLKHPYVQGKNINLLCRSVDESWSHLETRHAPGQASGRSTLWWYAVGNCFCTAYSLSGSESYSDHEIVYGWWRFWRNQVEW